MDRKVPRQDPVEGQLKPLSASRVKTLENCSWLYWCNYHLKLPQMKNEGAKKGDICHLVFEVLLNKDRKHYFKKMVEDNSVTVVPSIERLIKKHIKALKLHDTTDGFRHIDEMILVGLKNDFYVKGGKLVAPEFKFDIVSEHPRFRIKGFMDKPFIRSDEIIIDDFKSSKKKFEGEDQESNLQALFYSFAAKCLWPELTPTVRFVFLQYPRDPIMAVKFTDDALLGFSYYLEATQLRIEGFNEYAAKNNFAADQPAGTNTFTGKSLCGWATHPDQLKKDGTKMWHCPYRFAYDYFAVEKDGKIVYTVLEQSDIKKLKIGETIEKCHYDGCPKYRNPFDDMGAKVNKPEAQKKYTNVLDDF
jgi:hypothetical protein